MSDFIATNVLPGRYRRQSPIGNLVDLKLSSIPVLLESSVDKGFTQPVYDAAALEWLIARLGEHPRRGVAGVDMRMVEVDGQAAGWFITVDTGDATTETVQVAAVPQHRRLVFDHLKNRALERGSTLLCGRFDPLFRDVLVEQGTNCVLGNPWVVVHSNDPEIQQSFERGTVFFSRLEAEWWIAS